MNKNYVFYVGMVAMMLLPGSCLSAMEYQRLFDDQEQRRNNEAQFLDAVERADIEEVKRILEDSFIDMAILGNAFELVISGNCAQSEAGNSKMLSVISDAITTFNAAKEWEHKPKRARKQTKKVAFASKPQQYPWTPIAWFAAVGAPIALVNMNG